MSNPVLSNVLNSFLQSFGAVGYFNYAGSFVTATLDVISSVDYNIEDSDLYLDETGNITYSLESTGSDKIITGIRLNYKLITPSKKYAAQKYLLHTGEGNLVDSEAGLYSGYLQDAYLHLGQSKVLTVNCPFIRAELTAEKLIKLLIRMRYKQLSILTVRCKYNLLIAEIGDKVGITATILPTIIQGKYWMVVGTRIQPPINGIMPDIFLTLLELSDFPAPEEIDEGDGAITNTTWPDYEEHDGVIDNTNFQTLIKG